MPIDREIHFKKTCTVPNCEKKHSGKGYCRIHYRQYAKGVKHEDMYTPRPWVNKPASLRRICTHDGCNLTVRVRKLCSYHYEKLCRGDFEPYDFKVHRKETLSREDVFKVLFYNPETGDLKWREGTRGYSFNPGQAGSKMPIGYRQIKIGPKFYYVHRVAFLYMTGEMPITVDHINGIKDDNRWSNLRAATRLEQARNMPPPKNKKRDGLPSGVYELTSMREVRGYAARIYVNGTYTVLGEFSTPEEASSVYEAKAKELRGKFYCEWERAIPPVEKQCHTNGCENIKYARNMCRNHYEKNRKEENSKQTGKPSGKLS